MININTNPSPVRGEPRKYFLLFLLAIHSIHYDYDYGAFPRSRLRDDTILRDDYDYAVKLTLG